MIKANISLDIQQVLAPGGTISRSFPGFESRPQQVQMACHIQKAFVNGCHLVAEAGTGVGKSFAYLIPAIDILARKKGKVLVSTFTITLQEQLINKDIPFLAEFLPVPFNAVLAKGRGNYLCKRRLAFALRRQSSLFDRSGSALAAISNWASQTKDGSLSDMSFIPAGDVWDAVKSEHGNCRSRRCPHFQNCFYWRARRRLENADIIVANHALMFSDLVLKEQGVSLLPDYRFAIVDEAHNIEHVAEDHFGINISNYTVKFMLDGLYNPRTRKGLLAYKKADDVIDTVVRTGRQSVKFFKTVRSWYQDAKGQTGGRCYSNFVDDILSEPLKNLRSSLSKLANNTEDFDEKFEFTRYVDRCAALAQDMDCFLSQKDAGYVYWVEVIEKAGRATRLRSAPINVGPNVKNCLFDKYDSVILTSATLSSGSVEAEEGFDFFAGRIGLDEFDAVKLGSPFDYQKQVTIYIEKDLPNPNDPAFIEAATETLKKYLLETAGRAFVLFTSYNMLDKIAEKLSGWLAENDIELLLHGAGIDRTTLLKLFKEQPRSVLFGTDSFWQGVDVPGETLSNVIIMRLPFAVPDQPLLAGRLEQIKEQGRNPFYDYQLPSAIIKFKQGFGRLIRNKTDTGIVVVLDSRIINKAYGPNFLAAIPKCKVEIVPASK
jgi:ATP-dependent DNA helicase DinG